MKILTPGHKYELAHFEDPAHCETIQFIEKRAVNIPDAPLEVVNDGTTNEEVLTMLIDRLSFLGDRLPSRENALAKTRCEEALMWLNKRTAERIKRGVEGTHKA